MTAPIAAAEVARKCRLVGVMTYSRRCVCEFLRTPEGVRPSRTAKEAALTHLFQINTVSRELDHIFERQNIALGSHVASEGKARTISAATMISRKYGVEPANILPSVAVGSGTEPFTV